MMMCCVFACVCAQYIEERYTDGDGDGDGDDDDVWCVLPHIEKRNTDAGHSVLRGGGAALWWWVG